MAVPEINRLNAQTHSELKEFRTVPFLKDGGTEAQSQRLQQALSFSLVSKSVQDDCFRRLYDITEVV